MSKGLKFFTNIGANFAIILMLGVLCVLTFTNDVKSVFSPNYENLYYRGDVNKNNVSLMVNVYWGNEYLPSMLKTFKEYDTKTTFFVGGMWVSKYPEELLNLINLGHEIGNHGFFHKQQDKLSYNENQAEILNTHKLVKEYAKKDINLFAPPSGAFNDATIQAATNLGYKVIMWSRDTIDWRDHDENIIFSRATKSLSNGELVLMHPTLETAKALPKILKYCRENNLKVVPVSQNIAV